MLELKNVSKTYKVKKGKRKGKVLQEPIKNLSFKADKGDFVTILGDGGYAKQTVLNMIVGMQTMDKGSVITFDDFNSETAKERDWGNFRNVHVGPIYYGFYLMEHLNVVDNVGTSILFLRIPYWKGRKHAHKWLKKVDMDDKAKLLPKDLSAFERQKVCLARAFAKNPEIILCSEPCAELTKDEAKYVMDFIKREAKDKIVIMATSDEKLAREYSTQIYKLDDGEVTEIPVAPKEEPTRQLASESDLPPSIVAMDAANKDNKKPKKQTSDTVERRKKKKRRFIALSLTGALKMALESMRKRRIRYILAILAGAVGIIAIGVVLSISTGLNNYIKLAQDTIYSQNPIVFSQSRDVSKIDTYTQEKEKLDEKQDANREEINKAKEDAKKNGKVALNNIMGVLLSTTGTTDTLNNVRASNDIASLKKHLDTNPQNINSCVADMEYAYRTSPIIYADNINGIKEIYPVSGLFGSIGSGSGASSLTALSTKRATATSEFSAKKLLVNIGALPRQQSIYRDDDCLVAGHWPETPYECLLVLTLDGKIDDTLLYILGMRDFKKDIEPLLEKYSKGEAVTFPGQADTFEYTDFLGIKFKMINPSACYQKNSKGIWKDMSMDSEHMEKVVRSGKDMEIVGVVYPSLTSVTHLLNTGIQFPYDLNEVSIEETQNAQIVQDQLKNPKVDVLTGETFEYLKGASTIFQRFDFNNLVNFKPEMIVDSIKINPDALKLNLPKDQEKKEMTQEELIQVLIKLIQSKDFQEFIYDITKEGKFDEGVYKILANAATKYFQYVQETTEKGDEPMSADQWFAYPNQGYLYVYEATKQLPINLIQDVRAFISKYGPKVVDKFVDLILNEVQTIFTQLVEAVTDENRPSFIEFDADTFAKALNLNITMDDIKQMGYFLSGSASHTFEDNLADFGYADLNDPISLTIYPKDYASKQTILSVIKNYNASMKKSDENKVVTYTDNASTGIEIATKAVSAISGFLVALIAIISLSTVVMIGIIIGITCLQRYQEIGIVRTLGGRRRDVAKMFNVESVVIGLFIGIIGVLVTAIINTLINNSLGGSELATLPFTTGLFLVLGSILVTFLAGLIPVTITSRKSPIEDIPQ